MISPQFGSAYILPYLSYDRPDSLGARKPGFCFKFTSDDTPSIHWLSLNGPVIGTSDWARRVPAAMKAELYPIRTADQGHYANTALPVPAGVLLAIQGILDNAGVQNRIAFMGQAFQDATAILKQMLSNLLSGQRDYRDDYSQLGPIDVIRI